MTEIQGEGIAAGMEVITGLQANPASKARPAASTPRLGI
jgi:hypothetical protein